MIFQDHGLLERNVVIQINPVRASHNENSMSVSHIEKIYLYRSILIVSLSSEEYSSVGLRQMEL